MTIFRRSVLLARGGMIPNYFYPVTVALCLIAVTVVYFLNNPLKHGQWFLMRRFINWLPLGMSYAFLCMARYNLNVAQGALGPLMSNQDFGIIFATGTWTYALSFLVNGPLIDKKIGGRNAMLISTLGSALANIALGILTWLIIAKQLKVNVVVAFSLIYSVNMYFQSFGAMSIIKVKAYWFHVRERGVFGAIFGTFISAGAYFAFDWSSAVVSLTSANAPDNLLKKIFAPAGSGFDATWAVFFVPAIILIIWLILDAWLIKNAPEDAKFPHFDTHDASSGQMHVEFSVLDLLGKIFASRLMIFIACVEFAGGVFRYSIWTWYKPFCQAVPQTGAEFFNDHWGWFLCIFGIVGGLSAGLISDKLFHSRRGPPTAFLCGSVLLMAVVMMLFLFSQPIVVGSMSVLIVMASIGVTSLMSGTAAADFGGRKATATCMGIINAFAYLGSGLQSLCIGFLVPDKHAPANGQFVLHFIPRDWHWWPVFVMPFAVVGTYLSIKIWHELPAATRKYIADVEKKSRESQS
ncbi:MAG TPA: MFS transporter [Verrucomicrobiae bacterium]|nr:MFS transporter [Verrucomicrobiae bacterium]